MGANTDTAVGAGAGAAPTAQRSKRSGATPPFNGWLVVDKDVGMTSTHVVSRVRRRARATKVGHGGTLDPLATGVLPLALGEATKTMTFVVDSTKCYRFTVCWGEQRDTDDADGATIARSLNRPSPADIEAALPAFCGTIMQVPPTYSAVKVAGRRAYDLARRDQAVRLAPRPVLIESLTLISAPDRDHAVLEMTCGKGGYVRALARDLAQALGTAGHVSALRRTRVGPFTLDHAISLADLADLADSAALARCLLPIEFGLAGVPVLPVTGNQVSRLRRGQAVPLVRAPVDATGERIVAPAIACAMFAQRPVALVHFADGQIQPTRVFNL